MTAPLNLKARRRALRGTPRPPGRGRGAGRVEPAPGPGTRDDGAARRGAALPGDHGAGLQGRRLPGHDPVRRRCRDPRALRPRAGCGLRHGGRLALRRHGRRVPERRGAARDQRRRPLAAGGPGFRQGRAGEPRPLQGLCAGARAHRQLRHQLDHRLRGDTPLGPHGLPGPARGRGGGKLWDAIFAASRVDGPDPVAAWERHNADLRARTRLAQRPSISRLSVSAAPAPT